MNDHENPIRHQRLSREAQSILATRGESGRFEFEESADAVTATVMVAAANWSAQRDGEPVTILVGVREENDPVTGLSFGTIAGVSRLSREIGKLTSRARDTWPIPVSLTVIEEAVATSSPFLRLEIRATSAPHYDNSGRRVTRDGASTRPLTDEELLAMYLDREGDRFATRFAATAAALEMTLEAGAREIGLMTTAIASLSGEVGGAQAAGQEAAYESERAQRESEELVESIKDLSEMIRDEFDLLPIHLPLRLRHARRRVWRAFTVDSLLRPSAAAASLMPRLKRLLEKPIDVDQNLINYHEHWLWQEVVEGHARPSSMRWWLQQTRRLELASAVKVDVSMPDERAQLEHALSEGTSWESVLIPAWTVG